MEVFEIWLFVLSLLFFVLGAFGAIFFQPTC